MSDNIETPEGWERRGPCFTRVYDGKFAVLEHDPDDGDWYASVHIEAGVTRDHNWCPIAEAVAWANAELGVPQPVEVVEEKFPDGSRVIKDSANTRWATVCKFGVRWYVTTVIDQDGFPDEETALEAARRYVRGDA